jgi:hypothetical protein
MSTGTGNLGITSTPQPARPLRPHRETTGAGVAGTAIGQLRSRSRWADAAIAWHLFSLDAPTVAVVWCWFWGAVFHIGFSRVTLPILAMGTWIVYVADRLLDGYSTADTACLRDRHWFYLRHRKLFTLACLLVAAPLAWLILKDAQTEVRWGDIALCLLGLAYFFLVHARSTHSSKQAPQPWPVPKELAVGFLFAAACALPAWLRASHPPAMLLTGTLGFSALCSLNCVAIQTWEDQEAAQEVVHSILSRKNARLGSHPWTTFLGRHLAAWSVLLMGIGIVGIVTAPNQTLALPWAAIAASAGVFRLLLHWRRSLSALTLRIAADAALLTPLLLWPLLR